MTTLKQDLTETLREVIKDNLKDYREDIIKAVKNGVEKDLMEGMETRIEKKQEELLLKKFDGVLNDIKCGGFKDSTDLKKHIREVMDIQEEMVSKMHKKRTESFDVGDVANQLKGLGSSVNANRREIEKLVSEIETLKKRPRTVAVADGETEEVRKDLEEKFFDINKRLEQTKINLMGEISRVENKKPPAVPDSGDSKEEEKQLISRIEGLENEIYDLKHRKKSRDSGAVILE